MRNLLRGLLPLLVCGLATGATGWFAAARFLERPVEVRQPPRPADELARVGDISITARQLSEVRARRQTSGDSESEKSTLLDGLIRRELIFAEAQRSGFTEGDEIRTAWRSFIASRFQEELETQRTKPAPITDEEILAHHSAHLDEYSTAERRRFAIIFFPTPPNTDPGRRLQVAEEVQLVREQAIAGSATCRDFGALAARYSAHHPSRYSGGDVGWLTRTQAGRAWPGEVADVGFALDRAGEISSVLATDEGWYLLKLIERQAPKPLSLDTVRERIHSELRRTRAAREEEDWLSELRQVHPVQVFTQKLDGVVFAGTSLDHKIPSLPKH